MDFGSKYDYSLITFLAAMSNSKAFDNHHFSVTSNTLVNVLTATVSVTAILASLPMR